MRHTKDSSVQSQSGGNAAAHLHLLPQRHVKEPATHRNIRLISMMMRRK